MIKFKAQIHLLLMVLFLLFPALLSIELKSEHVDYLIEFFNNFPKKLYQHRRYTISSPIVAQPKKINLPKINVINNQQDGGISIEEFDKFLEDYYKIAYYNFKLADENGDGKFDWTEKTKLMLSHLEKIKQIEELKTEMTEYEMENLTLTKVKKGVKISKKLTNKMSTAMEEKTYMQQFADLHGTIHLLRTMKLIAIIVGFDDENEMSISKEQFESLPEMCQILKQFVQNADMNGDGDGKADRQEMMAILDKSDENDEMLNDQPKEKWEL